MRSSVATRRTSVAARSSVHGPGDGACGRDARTLHREAALEEDGLLPLDLDLAADAHGRVAQSALARSERAVDGHVEEQRGQKIVVGALVAEVLDVVAARVEVDGNGHHLRCLSEPAVDAGRAI